MPLIFSLIKGFFNGENMFNFDAVLTIGEIEYSYGPFGYAHYYHPKKESWEMSASISNQKLEEMRIEQESLNGEFNDQ